MRKPMCFRYAKQEDLCLQTAERDTIVAIIGKSGSGKSEIVKRYGDIGYNVIQSYTDRPKRYPEEWGHIFISTEEVEKYKSSMIAYTFFHGYHYFATREQYRGKGVTFYVIDPYGVKGLKEKVKDADLVFVYINTDENVRIERMVNRMLENNPEPIEEIVQAYYNNARDRAEYDRTVFAAVECDYVIDNNGRIEDTIIALDSILKLKSNFHH
jgi:guanylate kinase